jgi:hypothetical protein
MVTFTKLQEIQLRLAQIIPPIFYSLDDEDCAMDADDPKDEEKDTDVSHSIMFGGSRYKPIPTFEKSLQPLRGNFLINVSRWY